MKILHTNDEGVEETYIVSKPSAKMIWKLTKLDPDKMDDEESMGILNKYLQKLIKNGPLGNGDTYKKMDLADELEGDLFFLLFAETAGPALKQAKKLSNL